MQTTIPSILKKDGSAETYTLSREHQLCPCKPFSLEYSSLPRGSAVGLLFDKDNNDNPLLADVLILVN